MSEEIKKVLMGDGIKVLLGLIGIALLIFLAFGGNSLFYKHASGAGRNATRISFSGGCHESPGHIAMKLSVPIQRIE